ncbi:hypothetical protein J421_5525 (plasmid) [Gemmatirosa kalamazoonensis]|uniref:HPr kinase n=1 Tax=Gemmatirosa kalamazoonensis TaxID=861299 RepID=W0RRV3_9BACT|nr:hypothetical protein [Gemmatirosa kalamazoonensis]AHG93060.1 hypothetical protein J421_5525 [Gemmatirosa kalamazoonensis]
MDAPGARLAFEGFGFRYAIDLDAPTEFAQLRQHLLPGSVPVIGDEPAARYAITRACAERRFTLACDGEILLADSAPPDVLHAFRSHVRLRMALAAGRWAFVHAGVVGWGDRVVVAVGRSFSGKTRLVAALLRCGATYYSDEYAAVDERGLVHPFPQPLSVRADGERVGALRDPEALGAVVGSEPRRTALLVDVHHEPGARWDVRPLASVDVVLTMIAHTVAAQARPGHSLAVLARAAAGARGIIGVRGEAVDAAEAIVRLLEVG